MTRDVIVVPPELPLKLAWQVMQRERIRHLPVVRAGALIGILSDRDVLARGTLTDDREVDVPDGIVVGTAMTPTPMKTCEVSASISAVAQTMIEHKIDAIPVVNGLRLVGLVTSADLLGLLLEKDDGAPLPFDFRLFDDSRAYA